MDLFSFDNSEYVIMVDNYYSDYWEIDQLSTTTSAAVIKACKRQFARHGIPSTVIADGGLQFTSSEFLRFAENWDFELPAKSPYNSQPNGKAESAVKIAKKNIMLKAKHDG